MGIRDHFFDAHGKIGLINCRLVEKIETQSAGKKETFLVIIPFFMVKFLLIKFLLIKFDSV